MIFIWKSLVFLHSIKQSDWKQWRGPLSIVATLASITKGQRCLTSQRRTRRTPSNWDSLAVSVRYKRWASLRMERTWSEEQRNTGFHAHRTLAVRNTDASSWGKELPEGKAHIWIIEETNFKYWTEVSMVWILIYIYDFSLDWKCQIFPLKSCISYRRSPDLTAYICIECVVCIMLSFYQCILRWNVTNSLFVNHKMGCDRHWQLHASDSFHLLDHHPLYWWK